MSVCAYGDPHCPCQDGDACHYEDLPGSPAMVLPRRVPVGAEPPELVGYTTSDETDDVACEYCGDPSTSGVCERHVISDDYASPEVLRGRREHERWENG